MATSDVDTFTSTGMLLMKCQTQVQFGVEYHAMIVVYDVIESRPTVEELVGDI